jgi:hypothetical protein
MTAWVGAAPTGNRKRTVSTVEHTGQPSKRIKSIAPAPSKSVKPTTATRQGPLQGQSILKFMFFINLLYTVSNSSKASYN